jgi:hypothetical protein
MLYLTLSFSPPALVPIEWTGMTPSNETWNAESGVLNVEEIVEAPEMGPLFMRRTTGTSKQSPKSDAPCSSAIRTTGSFK